MEDGLAPTLSLLHAKGQLGPQAYSEAEFMEGLSVSSMQSGLDPRRRCLGSSQKGLGRDGEDLEPPQHWPPVPPLSCIPHP